jgi:signal transduction histidine kinase
MRLGIRRKLIGTLILVGLFPLAMSLVVVLGGGAAIQLNKIRGNFEDTAAASAEHISDVLIHEELEKLVLVSRFPRLIDYVHSKNKSIPPPGSSNPRPGPDADRLDRVWSSLDPSDHQVASILSNELSDRLKLLTSVDGHPRATMVTNAAGEVIAADSKTDDYFQADEDWWQVAYSNGRGRLYISSIIHDAAFPDGSRDRVEIAVPIFETIDGRKTVIGIMKDKLSAAWLLTALRDIPASKELVVLTQLIDLDSKTTVYALGADEASAKTTADFYFQHSGEPRVHALTLLFKNLIMGSKKVDLAGNIAHEFAGAQMPQWVVVVSKPSEEAMNPVYRLAATIAAIGIVLILVLFILGVAISNREIIMPILRLREATAAVGRGELNVRLLSTDASDPTFRRDELGELAGDFDEMTRELQKNVNQLARSNEAKRRFMELAGHELRTPVTYLLGACQLAQKQLQQLSAVATDGGAEDQPTVALAARNAAAVTSALLKISAKTQRLSRIIDNLLKLVNNDQFTTRMNKQPVDMRALILQVTADHRPFIAERKQQLVVEVAENLPSIEADRDKLEDALSNLVSNAIRFSPDGGQVRVAAHEVVGDMLEILVEDSGPGIPQEDLANLFEPFYTGSDILHHHSGTFEYGSKGLGLGLAIVRRFIELHGGIVRAHAINSPAEGGGGGGGGGGKRITGTRFQILLPLNKGEAIDSPANQSADGPTGLLSTDGASPDPTAAPLPPSTTPAAQDPQPHRDNDPGQN